ncbi:MAG: APC family permease [Gemmatimonadetes bacterium]|nr:APC family permease [Gemmatimonadota bacterium]MBT8403101.1 APC family permease [Gemmatimonadota bacterium]NNK63953.1 APC family permease [Gemmatimonadota bacterium]
MKQVYEKDSLSLFGAVSMGTGVMIGAAVFALTGQVAEFAGALLPLAFLLAAVVSGFSAYAYVKMSDAYPSAGGIAMYLRKAYGPGTVTGASSLLMAFSMIINESLVARTFGAYTLRLFDVEAGSAWISVLAVGLIVFAFLVNVAGNRVVGGLQQVTALLKIGGIVVFAVAALWASGLSFRAAADGIASTTSPDGFLAGVALAILAYKGFTTITNSGAEVVDPHKNVGRAIVISLGICLVVYLLVALAVGANLSVPEIIRARDYSLAEAARPALGSYGVWFTVAIAILATASGLIASVFAVSRMIAMLTDMDIIPHRHFGMSGTVQRHTLVYTVVAAALLAVLFDLSRIASLGAIFYLVMDIVVQWGVFRRLRTEIGASGAVILTAIGLDSVALGAFLFIKFAADPLIVWVALGGIILVFGLERLFLGTRRRSTG